MNELINSIFGNTGTPTVTYCEPANISEFIARPGYAISNIPYILLGLYLLTIKRNERHSKSFGIISLLIGLASFTYDASYTYISQVVDLTVMFSFVALLLSINAQRLFSTSSLQRWALFSSMVLVYLAGILVLKGGFGSVLFGAAVVLTIASELFIYSKSRSYSLRYWLIGLAFFIVGWLIWLLDANGIWCDPSNLFNGRAVYHYLTTVTIYMLWRHYLAREGRLGG